jgi:hypothetical protein
MTKANKPTTRLTYSTFREGSKSRQIAVTIHPTWLALRLKGRRKVFQLDIAAAYERAVMAEVEKIRADKRAAKKARRKKM